MQSIVSYPTRGKYGQSNWRGNCSGLLIRDLLEHYRPTTFVDPACGSNSSGDVVSELRSEGVQLDYIGLDLHSGFNLLKDSLSERIGGKQADFCFFHPPYADVIKYSGNVWGTEAHPDDLSNCTDYTDYLVKMKMAMQNIYDAVRSGKNYTVLIGDLRKNGAYTSIQADLLQITPGTLEGIIIKAQHNTVSGRKNYSNFTQIPINHEYILNFRKEACVFGLLDTSLNISRKLQTLAEANWKATVQFALNRPGGQAKLPEIYRAIERSAPEKLQTRPNWQARVRRTLQQFFKPVERGVWAVAA